jgi:hypothetical protein
MTARKCIAKYSRHGSQLFKNKFRIYYQGGLDSYCQFYAIFNLINFLYFKKQQNDDFLGNGDLEDFKEFQAIRDLPAFNNFFPETPFGDDGMEAPALIDALELALKHAGLKSKARIEETLSIPIKDSPDDNGFRIGIEEAFTSPHGVIGLAAVHEEERDHIGHCVVFVGKNHLENTKIDSKDWDGIVLDSDRDYLYWRNINYENNPARPCIEIRRSNEKPIPIWWISSFISVSVA